MTPIHRLRLACIAFICCASSLCVRGEEVLFWGGEKGMLPVWLISGPTEKPDAGLEAGFGKNMPIQHASTETQSPTWSYKHTPKNALMYIGKPEAPGKASNYYYAFSKIVTDSDIGGVIVINAMTPLDIWLDGEKLGATRLVRRGSQAMHVGVFPVTLKKGKHPCLLRLGTVRGQAAFLIGMRNSSDFSRPLTGLCQILRMEKTGKKRMGEMLGLSCKLTPKPRFIDNAKKISVYFNFGAGSPLPPGALDLRIVNSFNPRKAIARTDTRDLKTALELGLSTRFEAPKELANGAELLAQIVCGDKIFAELPVGAYNESGLKARRQKLENDIAQIKEANQSSLALARLGLDQIDILCDGRKRRTKYYGENFSRLISRSEDALHAAKDKHDILADKSGVIEAAYISPADNSAQPYQLYAPPGWSEAKKLPLVVLLHGYVPSFNKLKWMDVNEGMAEAMRKLNSFLVLPFGRSNTDFLSIGEVDVLRVISEMKARYPIDENRIYLCGYSMGGSGVWTLLSHYPDLFAAAQVWSGRTDYYFWHAEKIAAAGFTRETLPAYKRLLINTDNPYDLAATLRRIPLRAAHTKNDSLVKFGHSSRIFEKLKPPAGMMTMDVPVTNDGHWYFNREIGDAEKYRWMFEHKLSVPTEIEHICYTPKYGKKFWLSIDELAEWGKPAHIIASFDKAKKIVKVEKCENIAALTFSNLPGITDYKTLQLEFAAQLQQYGIMRKDGLTIRFSPAPAKFPPAKTREMSGPVKEAFNSPFLLVIGTDGDNEIKKAENRANAKQFSADWQTFARGKPRILEDWQVKKEEVEKYNLVLFGNPASNLTLRKIASRLPFVFEDNVYGVADKLVRGPRLGFAATYPNPDNPQKYVVVLDGIYYGQYLSFNHKWDLVPDYIIFGNATDSYDGTNTARLAGFFDSQWRFDPKLTYMPGGENDE